jgi:cell division protein FtsI/penicillin-binding protein 2
MVPVSKDQMLSYNLQFKERGKNIMEKVIVLFSVPIFLTFVLLIAIFVLAHYSGDEQTTKAAPAEVKVPDTPDKSEGADRLVT